MPGLSPAAGPHVQRWPLRSSGLPMGFAWASAARRGGGRTEPRQGAPREGSVHTAASLYRQSLCGVISKRKRSPPRTGRDAIGIRRLLPRSNARQTRRDETLRVRPSGAASSRRHVHLLSALVRVVEDFIHPLECLQGSTSRPQLARWSSRHP